MAATRSPDPARPLRGRQAEAAAHDVEITAAAFSTLTRNPRATMAEIADRAGVGVASLYRRYPNRQALAHALCVRAMGSIAEAARAGSEELEDDAADPWDAFVGFVVRAVGAGAGAMRTLAGTFDAGTDLADEAARMNRAIQRVVELAQQRGAVRADITAADLTQFFEMVRAVGVDTPERSDELRLRYLHLFCTALRAGVQSGPLPVAAPQWSEISAVWNEPAHPAQANPADNGPLTSTSSQSFMGRSGPLTSARNQD